MEPSATEGKRSSSLQTITEFSHVNANSNKRKRKSEATFVDFKELKTPVDNEIEIDGECFALASKDTEKIKCLFPFVDPDGREPKPLENFLNLPDKSIWKIRL